MTLLPTIDTERLCLRPFSLDDIDEYHRVVHSSPQVMRFLPGGKPRTRDQTAAALRYFIQHGNLWGFSFVALTDKTSGRLMGHVGLHKLPDAVEIGYALGVDHWGKGYATETARAPALRLRACRTGTDHRARLCREHAVTSGHAALGDGLQR